MKSLFAIVILLSIITRINSSDATAAIPKDTIRLTQEEIGIRLIHEIIHGDTESTSKYFEDSVKANLTQKTLESIRGQITWLSKLIGDTLEQLTTGVQTAQNGEKAFFREYRLANESNKRSPLIVVHVWFQDSTAARAAGAFVKTYLEDSEKRLDGEQTWKIGGKNVDVNSLALIDFKEGGMLAVKVYDDDDTAALDSNRVNAKGIPIVKEAIARGFLTKAKTELHDKKLLESVGVAFIRKSLHIGYTQYKFGISSKYFQAEWDSVNGPTPPPAPKTMTTPKTPTKKKGGKAK